MFIDFRERERESERERERNISLLPPIHSLTGTGDYTGRGIILVCAQMGNQTPNLR